MKSHLDIPYAVPDASPLYLDLCLPDDIDRPPLLVCIHGGGWRNGSRKSERLMWLAEHGYAVAHIDYRLSDRATYPAQIHDCKGAVRWLRANAGRYGYDATCVGALGGSAGGHLAMLLGVTADRPECEGDVGGNGDQSSRVHAVVSYAGPADFILRWRNQPAKTEEPDSPVYRLLGGPVGANQPLARAASPAWQVGPDAAPLLMLHGTADKTVLPDQSQRMLNVYRQHRHPATLDLVQDATHGDKRLFNPPYRQPVVDFLSEHLGQSRVPAPDSVAQ